MASQVNTINKIAASSSRLNRREILKLSGLLAAILALPVEYGTHLAKALVSAGRVPVVWLEFQGCTGDSESFLRASPYPDPLQPGVTDLGIVDLLLDAISVEYHETLMAPSGANSEKSLSDAIANYYGQYVLVVEGSIPQGNNGVYCVIGGRTAVSRLQEVAPSALATIAVGACAVDGGLSAAAPNLTGAVGVKDVLPGLTNYLALPGCPANVVNLVASIVYLKTFGQLPDRDSAGKPYFAYSHEIHENCERKPFYEQEKFVRTWGDSGHRQGWCLKEMGCKGPDTHNNCPIVKWNAQTNWPVGAGHPCVGCAEPHFWDNMTPFYAGDD